MSFLGDFANSSVSPSTCVRDFSDSCRGKADEKATSSGTANTSSIVGSSLRLQNVTRRREWHDAANMTVACSFTSRITKCEPGDSGCAVGAVGTVAGDCRLTGVYEQQRWWLCTSNFDGAQVPGFRSFFSSKAK